MVEAKAAAPQAPLPHSRGCFPELGILSPGILCFHRHSRFVPAVLNTATDATDFVAVATSASFSNDTSPDIDSFPEPWITLSAFCGLEARAPPEALRLPPSASVWRRSG